MRSRSASPPTRRVIDIVELLMASDRRYSVTEIAATLAITRATAVAVLAELQAAGWVSRDPDRTYSRGPGLEDLAVSPVADAESDHVHTALAKLSRQFKCGVSLSAIEPDHFTVLHKSQVLHHPVTGFAVGQRNPLRFPAGAAVLIQRSAAEQRAWLETAPGVSAAQRRRLLQLARTNKVVLYRPAEQDAALVGLLAELLNQVGEHNLQPNLREQLLDRIAQLSSGALYTPDDIDAELAMPVSYLTAAVYDNQGRAAYELQIAPLSANVTRQRRHELITAAVRTARDLQGRRLRPCRHSSQRCR